jgi:hypothetical protein
MFHQVNWEIICTLGNLYNFDVIQTRDQPQALCEKWVVQLMEGKEIRNVILRHQI